MSDATSQPPPPGATPPPAGPPPGAAPSQPPPAAPAPGAAQPAGPRVSGSAWWGVIAVVAMALAVTLPEDDDTGWERFGVWAGVAIAAALATLAPAVRDQLKVRAETAWQAATVGGVVLAGWWVLFVLPSIERNVSFLATIGCAAGMYAAWRAPGRPLSPGARSF